MTNIVATLAQSIDSPTCSAIIARQLGFKLLPCSSFEKAIDSVKNGLAQYALVPGAYPDIRSFLMDGSLNLSKAFAKPIPNMVLAKPDTEIKSKTIYAHPATKPLWGDYESDYLMYPILSNEECAKLAKKKSTYCITNEAAAIAENLIVLDVLRKSANMSWNLFSKK